jgi:hypothetical protein
MKFMLIMRDSPEMFAGVSPAHMPAVIEEYVGWTKQMQAGGHYLGGDKLVTDEPGRMLRGGSGGLEVQDGGSGGLVGGTMVLQARDYAEACSLAETNPQLKYGGTIEVRQVDEI